MSYAPIITLTAVLLIAATVTASTCPAAQTLKAYTMSCEVANLTYDLQWTSSGLASQAATCAPNGGCDDTDPDRYTATIESLPARGFKSELTIVGVTREEDEGNKWSCHADGRLIYVCDLRVYAVPATPHCDKPVILDPGPDAVLSVNCFSNEVYPDAECAFFQWKNDLITSTVTGRPITYQRVPPYIGCEFNITVSSLGPGTFAYRVHVQSNIEGELIGPVVDSDDSEPVRMNRPQARLGSNCRSNGGYVLHNTNTSCSCVRYDAGYPPGLAHWTNRDGVEVGTQGGNQEFSSLDVTVLKDGPNQEYNCTVRNDQGTSKIVSYMPKPTWGPTEVQLTLSEDPKNLCPGHSKVLTVTCTVPESDAHPAPIINSTIKIGDSVKQSPRNAGILEGDHYSHRFKRFLLFVQGPVEVICQAWNPHYPLVTVTQHTGVRVLEPPNLPLTMTIGGQTVTEEDGALTIDNPGQSLTIRCEVNGGYPVEKWYSITCGAEFSASVYAENMTAEVPVTSGLNGQRCTCEVGHESGCYNRTKSATLDIAASLQISTPLTTRSPADSTTPESKRTQDNREEPTTGTAPDATTPKSMRAQDNREEPSTGTPQDATTPESNRTQGNIEEPTKDTVNSDMSMPLMLGVIVGAVSLVVLVVLLLILLRRCRNRPSKSKKGQQPKRGEDQGVNQEYVNPTFADEDSAHFYEDPEGMLPNSEYAILPDTRVQDDYDFKRRSSGYYADFIMPDVLPLGEPGNRDTYVVQPPLPTLHRDNAQEMNENEMNSTIEDKLSEYSDKGGQDLGYIDTNLESFSPPSQGANTYPKAIPNDYV